MDKHAEDNKDYTYSQVNLSKIIKLYAFAAKNVVWLLN